MPWTAAEFEQLKGRIYRQGQRQENVTMILPLTFAEVPGKRWSWGQSKMQWKFTHIRAIKTERRPREDVELRF